MMKGFGLDHESIMSNLTSTLSAETSISSTTRNDQSPSSFASPNHAHLPPPSSKKKRSLPGNPDPDAEVVALSPKSLLATNRFICEICNKGFQRDQNLQLHRRGHNLPWKLKQRPKGEVVRKKVYVCPEPGCPHHDPARALGDLTGIKKHFCRKHGEKKWKCDKCSKKYAVQSDWKAHYKICGTKEYRCDCGTLFSRRDSFITHRAFCDALAAAEDQSGILPSNVHVSFPPWLSPPPPQHPTHVYVAPPPMSATALLQKAAEMGVNLMSTTTTSTSAGGMCSSRDLNDIMLMSSLHSTSAGSDVNYKNQLNQKLNETHHQLLYEHEGNQGVVMMTSAGGGNPRPPTAFNGGGDEPNTRDFLGLRGLTQNDLINMAAGQFRAQINPSNSFDHHNFLGHNHQNQNQTYW